MAAPVKKSFVFDADLYHRALTGRGSPITSEEVIALLNWIEGSQEELERETERVEKENEGLNEKITALEDEVEELKAKLATDAEVDPIIIGQPRRGRPGPVELRLWTIEAMS